MRREGNDLQDSLFSKENPTDFLPKRDRAVQAVTTRGQSRDTGDLGPLQKGKLEGIEKRGASDCLFGFFFLILLLFISLYSL